MSLHQGILYIRANNGLVEGWLEGGYYDISDPATLATLLLGTIAPARAVLLSSQAEIHAIRAAEVGTRKGVLVRPTSPIVGTQGPVDEFATALIFNGFSGSAARRELPFRGVPDSVITGNKIAPGGNVYVDAVKTYCNTILKNAGFGLKIPNTANTRVNITSMITPTVGAPIEVTVDNPLNAVTGDVVRISALRNNPTLNGTWQVGTIATNQLSFTLRGSQRYVPQSPTTGKVQKITPLFSSLQLAAFVGPGRRETGVPFGHPRGKRSARVLHH